MVFRSTSWLEQGVVDMAGPPIVPSPTRAVISQSHRSLTLRALVRWGRDELILHQRGKLSHFPALRCAQ